MRHARGFTIVEMMVTVAVLAILVVLGVPTMRGVIENGRIRAAGESLKYGLTLARTEAVRRNALVEFLTDGTGWNITTNVGGAPVVLHQGSGREGPTGLDLAILPAGADRVTFDSFGRIVDPNPDGSEPIAQIDIASEAPPTVDGYRPLTVQMLPSGVARLCDPAVGATDSRACL